jgi:hypothetical protein
MIGRLLGRVPEIRSLFAVVGTLLAAGGIATLSDGLPAWVRVGLAGVAVLVLAGAAALRVPSAVATALVGLALIGTPAVLIATAGAGIVALALAGGTALGLVVVAEHAPRRLAHPRPSFG